MNNKEKLQKQIDEIENLKNLRHGTAEFYGWEKKTCRVLGTIFGENSQHLKDFSNISYRSRVLPIEDYKHQQIYVSGLENAYITLLSMLEEIEDLKPIISNNSINLENIFNKFHLVARQLKERYNHRITLDINDEYDIQDLLHALLRQYFDDIRPEERTPSYAGSSKRTDFILKNEQIIIEVKKTRAGLKDKEIGEQLIIDIANYKNHSDCKELVCFVYDPDGYIKNPRGIENDLGRNADIKVTIFIRPIL